MNMDANQNKKREVCKSQNRPKEESSTVWHWYLSGNALMTQQNSQNSKNPDVASAHLAGCLCHLTPPPAASTTTNQRHTLTTAMAATFKPFELTNECLQPSDSSATHEAMMAWPTKVQGSGKLKKAHSFHAAAVCWHTNSKRTGLALLNIMRHGKPSVVEGFLPESHVYSAVPRREVARSASFCQKMASSSSGVAS